jgi:hypothetical protein
VRCKEGVEINEWIIGDGGGTYKIIRWEGRGWGWNPMCRQIRTRLTEISLGHRRKRRGLVAILNREMMGFKFTQGAGGGGR